MGVFSCVELWKLISGRFRMLSLPPLMSLCVTITAILEWPMTPTVPRCYTMHSWFTRLSRNSSRCGERVTTCCLQEAQDWLCIFSWMERGNKPPNPRFHQERMIYMLCKKPALWSFASPSSRPQPSGASGGQRASEVRPWRREKREGFRVRNSNPWWGLASAGTSSPRPPNWTVLCLSGGFSGSRSHHCEILCVSSCSFFCCCSPLFFLYSTEISVFSAFLFVVKQTLYTILTVKKKKNE